MIKKVVRYTLVILLTGTIVACGSEGNKKTEEIKSLNNQIATETKVKGRWYTTAQKRQGKKVFAENCSVCHGDKGQGLTADWQKTDAEGKFPPPPINGSAHAWHHSKALLLRTVNEGGVALGGSMPSFKDKLSDKEKEAVLAYVMSLWPEKTYEIWQKRNPSTK